MTYVVAVRAMCEFTARRGDLDLRFTPAPTSLEGMAGHLAVAGRRASGFYLQHIAANREQMIDAFLKAARALIAEDGADVIIPQGITQCPVQMKPDWPSKELGVPVVEGIGAPIRMAAMLAGLGLKHSRKRWPKSNARPEVG